MSRSLLGRLAGTLALIACLFIHGDMAAAAPTGIGGGSWGSGGGLLGGRRPIRNLLDRVGGGSAGSVGGSAGSVGGSVGGSRGGLLGGGGLLSRFRNRMAGGRNGGSTGWNSGGGFASTGSGGGWNSGGGWASSGSLGYSSTGGYGSAGMSFASTGGYGSTGISYGSTGGSYAPSSLGVLGAGTIYGGYADAGSKSYSTDIPFANNPVVSFGMGIPDETSYLDPSTGSNIMGGVMNSAVAVPGIPMDGAMIGGVVNGGVIGATGVPAGNNMMPFDSNIPFDSGSGFQSDGMENMIHGEIAPRGIYQDNPGGGGFEQPPLPGPGGDGGDTTDREDTRVNPQHGLDATEAILSIRTDEDATIFINGLETSTGGELRRYATRDLRAGKTYEYTIRAEANRDGREVVRTKTVRLTGGTSQSLAVNFAQPPVTVLAVRVPEDAKVTLCGKETPATGDTRFYKTTSLGDGETWEDYKIVVSVVRDGRTITSEKLIDMKSGETRVLAFDLDSMETRVAKK